MITIEYIKILIKYYPRDIEKKVDHPRERNSLSEITFLEEIENGIR